MTRENQKLPRGVRVTMSYTRAQVHEHRTKDDLWLVIDGKVYDVTMFQEEHPGGAAALQAYGGADASQAFLKIPDHEDNEEVKQYLEAKGT